MSVDDYKWKMKLLLNDKNRNKVVKRNPLTCLQKSVKSTLMELNEIDALNKKLRNITV